MKRLLLMLLFCASTVAAQDKMPMWKKIGETETAVIDIDTNNVKRHKSFVEFMERATVKTKGALVVFEVPISYLYRWTVLDCADSTFIRQIVMTTNEKNELVSRQETTITKFMPWESAPGSVVEPYLPFFCTSPTTSRKATR
jgi:hypothetical protein